MPVQRLVVASVALSLVVACGEEKKSKQQAAVQAPTLTQSGQTRWCGVDNPPTMKRPGILAPTGWNGQLPIVIKSSTAIAPALWAQIEKAHKTWETALGVTLFKFDGGDERTGDSFQTLEASLDDKLNGHYLDEQWEAHTGKSNQILGTTIYRNAPDGGIIEADIRYNTEDYIFGDAAAEAGDGTRPIVDMESLSLHEIGHFLGLAHTAAGEDPDSIMNPSVTVGEGQTARVPSAGDVEKLRSIYAAAP